MFNLICVPIHSTNLLCTVFSHTALVMTHYLTDIMTPAEFTACRAAHRILLQKRKTEEGKKEFPSARRVLAELEARLANHNSKWREVTYTLTPSQRRNANGMRQLLVIKAKNTGLKDISNFYYQL